MTTKELEKNLKISENTCIHCTTEELAKQVLSIFHQLGLTWCDENHYITYTHWDRYRKNTIYYPFTGECSSLVFAYAIDYKILKAEEFIALHTEEEKFDLENYIPKGELEGFPKEIIARMLDCQEEQGNPRDVSVFERQIDATQCNKGFDWGVTQKDWDFWHEVITNKDFDIFFKKYPKQDPQDNPQEFRVGDKVIDIITRQRGKIFKVSTNDGDTFHIFVSFNEEDEIYTLDGRYYGNDKYPRLLHYRDDYDYDVIDFNNLPKRQEPKRWRAEKGKTYYSFTFDFKVVDFYDTKRSLDNKAYDSGNYFQTKKEAQEMADKLNKYFQEISKRKGKTYYSFTSNFEIEDFYDDDDIFDKKAYELGNYFKTKEEAEIIAQKLNTYFKQLIEEPIRAIDLPLSEMQKGMLEEQKPKKH